MNVEQCMTRNPRTCSDSESLESAARIMWENDCGSVPIIDGSSRLVGMITDRDTCIAAYTQGAPLHAIRVSSAMARQVHACNPKDTLEAVERMMSTHRVRRLPVVDAQRRVIGIVSLADLARQSAKTGGSRASASAGLVGTLAAISTPHAHTAGDRMLAAQPSLTPQRASKSPSPRAAAPKAKAARRSR